jgi:hypothetical protein
VLLVCFLINTRPQPLVLLFFFLAKRNVLKKTNAEARARPGNLSRGHDSRKARTRRLDARLAYVIVALMIV